MFSGEPQAREAVAPERFQERPQILEALCADAVQTLRSLAPLGHEPCSREDGEVLGDSRPGDRELGRDFPSRALAVGYELENTPAVRLGDRA
jgi:hypothetical protein